MPTCFRCGKQVLQNVIHVSKPGPDAQTSVARMSVLTAKPSGVAFTGGCFWVFAPPWLMVEHMEIARQAMEKPCLVGKTQAMNPLPLAAVTGWTTRCENQPVSS